ncbi:FadR/GntR family transcriptional regulator [Ramlibacter sp. 2FC]|uniref:FadR/GntR family transcriptional regulator n=1 Tax=Ramlibacter sp. 2FC TaxID=2502188 RepID=UPI0010F8D32D|nr:FadR/GntR family transcriptional regulator [Ramlibacter sp. 2FC]
MQQDMRQKNQRISITRIAVPKPHDVLADHLRESILRGDFAEGEGLPSERELVEQTGLSRGAVREALRTLAVEGLVQTKLGRFGGSVVTLPGQASMATAIHRFVVGRRIPLRDLQETREILEPFLARLAAERRSEEHLKKIKALHEELIAAVHNFQDFALLNVKWHNAVAEASGNDLLATLLYSISHGVQIATFVEEYNTTETRKLVIAIHGRIIDAIEAGNAELAERSMRKHMSATHARPLAIASNQIPLTEEKPVRRSTVRATPRRAKK